MLITAEVPCGCGIARCLGHVNVPDTGSLSQEGIKGVFTGVRKLACVS